MVNVQCLMVNGEWSMNWMDVAAVVFFSTTVNHLGLISAIESSIKHRLWILDCPKCLTFWGILALGLSGDGLSAPPSSLLRLLAISILASYSAIWLELIEGIIDRLYDYIYGKIFTTADPAGADEAGA